MKKHFSIFILVLIVLSVLLTSCFGKSDSPSDASSRIVKADIGNATTVYMGRRTGSKATEEGAYLLKLENGIIKKVEYTLSDGTTTDAVVPLQYVYINHNYMRITFQYYGNYLINRNTGDCYKTEKTISNVFTEDVNGNLYFLNDNGSVLKCSFDNDEYKEIVFSNCFTPGYGDGRAYPYDIAADKNGNFAISFSCNNRYSTIYIYPSMLYGFNSSGNRVFSTHTDNVRNGHHFEVFDDNLGNLYFVNGFDDNGDDFISEYDLHKLTINSDGTYNNEILSTSWSCSYSYFTNNKAVILGDGCCLQNGVVVPSIVNEGPDAIQNYLIDNVGSKWYMVTYGDDFNGALTEYDASTGSIRRLITGVRDSNSKITFNGYNITDLWTDRNGTLWAIGNGKTLNISTSDGAITVVDNYGSISLMHLGFDF